MQNYDQDDLFKDEKMHILGLVEDTAIPDEVIAAGLFYLHQTTPETNYEMNVSYLSNLFDDLMISLILSSKYLMDNAWSNSCWSKQYSVSLDYINNNEVQFLRKINYNLNLDSRFCDFLHNYILPLSQNWETDLDDNSIVEVEEVPLELPEINEELLSLELNDQFKESLRF
ncbi:hypothetical protein M0812_24168 [Anaeramoeba flamelloides]|uniref:Cyclin N-terminal domain-containing protein n=1 Tax=Anaeramoeba flamelloides TaxID=1746091 RepID=A0AAV7YH90_9EUKA|nr:hypothetical protein M0812_24168 [Anaeramoeba flamelloides]